MNKTQIVIDKISTLSWIKHHEIWICHKGHSWNILEIFILIHEGLSKLHS
jgi:hypothetical protein